uniref:Uncharacterized protein n=1 Tax=Vitis vinifera TaxID=29760 RepID=A5B7B3_VITVI|nr:hypothetical protein VITISV_028897 [Vitis vinifera]
MDVSLESKSLPSVGNSRKSYLQVTSQKLARGKLVYLHGRRSLALPSVGSSELKRYQRIQTCLTGEVETPFSPIRHQAPDVKYPEKVESRSDTIPNVRYPEKVEHRPDRIPDVRYPKKVECRLNRILPRVE